MAKTMKAAVLHECGHHLPSRRCRSLTGSGLSPDQGGRDRRASYPDLRAVNGDWSAKPILPFTPGHEGAGTVAAIGAGVKGLREGDLIGVAWLHDACGGAKYCRTGWESLCLAQNNTGYSVNGSLAEYVIGAAPYVARLPKNADFVARDPILCAALARVIGWPRGS